MNRWSWILPWVLTGLAIAADGDSSSMPSAHQLTRQGTFAMLAGNAERAQEMFDRAVGLLADYPPAQMGLGHLAISSGRFQQALESYLVAIRGYERLGGRLLQTERERYADARATIVRLEQEIEENQRKLDRQLAGDRRSTEQIARLETRIGVYTAQIDQLRAVEFPPAARETPFEGAPGEAYFHLGNALFRLGQFRDAAEAWRTSAERSPEFALVHYNLVLVYLKLDMLDEARASLAEAERLGYDIHPRLRARVDPS